MARSSTDTKSRILKTTQALYSMHGSRGTTLDDIITAGGVTKGAFYHYFKSKEALCEMVVEQVIADYQALVGTLDTASEPIDRLRQMIAKLVELNVSGEWVNCRLIMRLSAECNGSSEKVQQKIYDFWQWYTAFYEDLIRKCRDASQLSDRLEVKTQVRLLICVMAGAITLEQVVSGTPTFADLAEIIIETLK